MITNCAWGVVHKKRLSCSNHGVEYALKNWFYLKPEFSLPVESLLSVLFVCSFRSRFVLNLLFPWESGCMEALINFLHFSDLFGHFSCFYLNFLFSLLQKMEMEFHNNMISNYQKWGKLSTPTFRYFRQIIFYLYQEQGKM